MQINKLTMQNVNKKHSHSVLPGYFIRKNKDHMQLLQTLHMTVADAYSTLIEEVKALCCSTFPTANLPVIGMPYEPVSCFCLSINAARFRKGK